MKSATNKQLALVEYISMYTKEYSCPPSISEMCAYFDVTSNAIFGQLLALEKKGYLRRVPRGTRKWVAVDRGAAR